jgi:hypothetical protein
MPISGAGGSEQEDRLSVLWKSLWNIGKASTIPSLQSLHLGKSSSAPKHEAHQWHDWQIMKFALLSLSP